MQPAPAFVPAFGYNSPVKHDYRTHKRIGINHSLPPLGQFHRPAHPFFVIL